MLCPYLYDWIVGKAVRLCQCVGKKHSTLGTQLTVSGKEMSAVTESKVTIAVLARFCTMSAELLEQLPPQDSHSLNAIALSPYASGTSVQYRQTFVPSVPSTPNSTMQNCLDCYRLGWSCFAITCVTIAPVSTWVSDGCVSICVVGRFGIEFASTKGKRYDNLGRAFRAVPHPQKPERRHRH